jgi:soluble lytic murein transglycosylase-like protein
MGLRLLMLLLVAAAAGALAGVAPKAPAASSSSLLTATPAAAAVSAEVVPCPIPARFRSAFEAAAADAGIPLAMLLAVATVESNLRPDVSSSAGAHGLLQVLPSTAAELELDTYHLGENVLAGARYLRMMLDRFESTDLALAAYNAGPTAVEARGASPNDETVAYVANVTATWRKLVGCV